MPGFLGVLAICKNEEHIVDEWLQHYRHEGVDGFLVIDNGSTDGTVDLLGQHADVSVVVDATRHSQSTLYNKYAPLGAYEWLLVLDFDEFAYGSTQTLAEVLRQLPTEVGAVRLPWLCFGSSGHGADQPPSVGNGFLWRAKYPDDDENPFCPGYKEIVRCRAVQALECHQHEISSEYRRVDDCLEPFRGVVFGETHFNRAHIRLNHYVIQSRDFFMRVKATRGDVGSQGAEHIRDEAYFDRADRNEVFDDRLPQKRNLSGQGH